MARLSKNRQTALTLALIAALLTSPTLVGRSLAVPVEGDGTGNHPPGTPNDGSGDPDVPTGPTRSSNVGAQRNVARPHATATLGDGRMSSNNVWMWRLRIVLRGLRAYTFRF